MIGRNVYQVNQSVEHSAAAHSDTPQQYIVTQDSS